MLKRYSLLLLSFWVFEAQANAVPTKIYFKENEKVSLALSPVSYNKILINNERITDFYFVNGDFIVADTNDLNEFLSKDDGSIYVVPQSDKNPIIYLATNKGHHVALEVSLNDKSGQVIALAYENRQSVAKSPIQKPTPAETILKDLVAHKLTSFQGGNVEDETAAQRQNNISLQRIQSYQKGAYKAFVYRVKNLSQQTIKISPKQFFEKNTQALSLDNEVLAPNQSTLVYSVIGDGRHA